MNTKKLIVAIIVAYMVLMATGYLIHGVWLKPTYEAMRDAGTSFRPVEMLRHKMWVLWVGNLLFTVLFAWIYTRGVENKSWAGQGLRYGIVMTLFAVVPFIVTEYYAYNIPYTLAVKWMVAGGVQLIILGLIVAGIMGPKKAAG